MWVPGVQLGGQHSGVETAGGAHLVVLHFCFCSHSCSRSCSCSRPWSVRLVAFLVAVVVAEMGQREEVVGLTWLVGHLKCRNGRVHLS